MAPLLIPARQEPPFPAVQLANTFIDRYGASGSIDHLKLQKLSYFTYGWWLAMMNGQEPLTNVRPQVWKLGPVFQPIYGAFASHKGDIITEQKPLGPFTPASSIARSDTPPSQFVDWIWSRYGHFTGFQLSDMTHEPGTPWYKIAKAHNFVIPRFSEMDEDENRAYFAELARKEGFLN